MVARPVRVTKTYKFTSFTGCRGVSATIDSNGKLRLYVSFGFGVQVCISEDNLSALEITRRIAA